MLPAQLDGGSSLSSCFSSIIAPTPRRHRDLAWCVRARVSVTRLSLHDKTNKNEKKTDNNELMKRGRQGG